MSRVAKRMRKAPAGAAELLGEVTPPVLASPASQPPVPSYPPPPGFRWVGVADASSQPAPRAARPAPRYEARGELEEEDDDDDPRSLDAARANLAVLDVVRRMEARMDGIETRLEGPSGVAWWAQLPTMLSWWICNAGVCCSCVIFFGIGAIAFVAALLMSWRPNWVVITLLACAAVLVAAWVRWMASFCTPQSLRWRGAPEREEQYAPRSRRAAAGAGY